MLQRWRVNFRVGDAAQFAPTIRKEHPKAVLLESTALNLDSPDLQVPLAS